GYFGAEFGNPPKSAMTIPAPLRRGFHGQLTETHQNSVFSARAFFQVGAVKPARENDYGFNAGFAVSQKTKLFLEASQNKIRGNVNGNVLVPRPDERTPLATDAVTRAILTRWLAAFPTELPNRTDINARLLNTNAPQIINGNQLGARLEQTLKTRDTLGLQYQFTSQNVDAFQFVAGQNPNTDTKSHLARVVWTRQWSAATISHLTASYDRLSTLLEPEKNAVGPFVIVPGLAFLGPDGAIPIDRAQNQIRFAGQLRHGSGAHNLTSGFTVLRRQLVGLESNSHRGFFFFSANFGRDAIANLRLGTATEYGQAIGNPQRDFRNLDMQYYAGDSWQARRGLTLLYGIRWQPWTKPVEADNLNVIPYGNDLNNVAPALGFAWRAPRQLGVLRGAYSVQFGEIFPVTFQQVRFNPPGAQRIQVNSPILITPLISSNPGPATAPQLETYPLHPDLATPYAHLYNVSWEPEWKGWMKLQLGYVGSRAHKLLTTWYTNRAHPRPGIALNTATINERRADLRYADVRVTANGSRGYYDAARVTLAIAGAPHLKDFSTDVSYWLSKAIDLGANYTSTASGRDSRESRSQYEYEIFRDMKGLSSFDQPHAFLWRSTYAPRVTTANRWMRYLGDGWNLSSVVLVKSGTAFSIQTGSDAPGFGNVDGSNNDRPNIIDPSILGRTIGHPDTSRQLLPRTAFAYPGVNEVRGNIGRNTFRKGAIRNVNASLSRAWSFARDMRLNFRAESINLFNTPQFADPGFELTNPNFAFITNTLNDGRAFRFALQLGW
ncbi:MAG: hypothetical protein ACKV2V_08940, partial [Blastocatellia bacterium]